MSNPLKRDGEIAPFAHTSLPSDTTAPLVEALRRHRRGYEIEDATLVEMAALLDSLSRKYRGQIERQIEDGRLLNSALKVEELHRGYLEQEADVTKAHIGRLYNLYRQARREHRVIRKWIGRLYPGWSRIFDEATRRAAQDKSAKA
jgi:hypothetical protein